MTGGISKYLNTWLCMLAGDYGWGVGARLIAPHTHERKVVRRQTPEGNHKGQYRGQIMMGLTLKRVANREWRVFWGRQSIGGGKLRADVATCIARNQWMIFKPEQ
ncbi:MAG TPA: hypothetical protein VF043_22990 [Ktedonobacteraceae bacterium]